MSSSRFLATSAVALALAVVTPARALDGAAVYKEQCAKCHGETGKADTPVAQALKVPSLLGDANVKKMSAKEIAQRIEANEKHPPTVKELDAAAVEAAAEYTKKLASE